MHWKSAASLPVSAFALHLAWEFAVCSTFYVEKLFPQTLLGMLWVTAGDVFWTVVIFLLVVTLRSMWARLLLAVCSGVAIATAVELHALATDRWGYSEAMPIVPLLRVGLVPLLQMALLPALSIWVTEWVNDGARYFAKSPDAGGKNASAGKPPAAGKEARRERARGDRRR